MASRLRAWLRRRMRSSGKALPRETTSGGPNKQPSPDVQKDSPPPPYNRLDLLRDGTPRAPRNADGSETIETLRARNPATRPPLEDSPILKPPRHMRTSNGAAKAAASSAVIGVVRALDEQDHRMIAARTAQAIAVAVSTSRSYASFVAAVTAAESTALLLHEVHRDHEPPGRCRERTRNAIRNAVSTAMAADAGITATGPWPFNVYDTHSPESSQRTAHKCQTRSCAPPSH